MTNRKIYDCTPSVSIIGYGSNTWKQSRWTPFPGKFACHDGWRQKYTSPFNRELSYFFGPVVAFCCHPPAQDCDVLDHCRPTASSWQQPRCRNAFLGLVSPRLWYAAATAARRSKSLPGDLQEVPGRSRNVKLY